MTKYAVGDNVWYAECQYKPISQLCPTCFGKKEVTLILGNGESVLLPCEGCARGYHPPTGYVSEYDFIARPKQIIITGMSVEIDRGEEKVVYKSDGYVFAAADVFQNEEEARIAVEAKKKKLDEEQRTKAEHIKKNVRKSFSWKAYYHMREAKKHRACVLYHEEKAQLCKERAKEDKP